jgi:glutathione S-transferase
MGTSCCGSRTRSCSISPAKREAFNKEAAVLDQHLAKRDWLVGSGPTLADFTVGSYLFYANDAKLPVAAYKNIGRWFERLSALPCWAETAPPPRPAVAA